MHAGRFVSAGMCATTFVTLASHLIVLRILVTNICCGTILFGFYVGVDAEGDAGEFIVQISIRFN